MGSIPIARSINTEDKQLRLRLTPIQQLTSVVLPNSGGTVSFKYDPFGRRIYKSSSAGTSIYAYDELNLIEEANASGGVVARYLQTENVDEPLTMFRSSATSYYELDGLSSVTSLSNTAGAVTQTYTYDSFGKTTASSGSLVNPFQYTGREFDAESRLYYYRARYYDPATGRFLSEDLIRWSSGTVDFYSYVQNDPTNLIDPFGLSAAPAATADCIENALQNLFPGVSASVGKEIRQNGGHANFPVHLQFPSSCAEKKFRDANNAAGKKAWGSFPPPARYGSGPTLHLENVVSVDSTSDNATAHIDLYNPNAHSKGGGGLGGLLGHVGIDGIVGHLADLLRKNIDPANCPWPPPGPGQSCKKGQPDDCGDSSGALK